MKIKLKKGLKIKRNFDLKKFLVGIIKKCTSKKI